MTQQPDSIYKKIKNYIKEHTFSYFPALSMLVLTVVTFFSGMSENIIILTLGSAILLGLGSFLLINKSKSHDQFADRILSVPAFIVSPSGEVISCNELGLDLVQDTDMQLATILVRDGLDEGAAYRLLNVKDTNIEKSIRFIYKSSLIDQNTILIVRLVNSNIMDQDIDIDAIKNSPEKQDLIDTLSDFPVGYFKKYQGTVDDDHNGETPILEMNKTLKEWIKNDQELLNHLNKFGSSVSKKIAGNVVNSKKFEYHKFEHKQQKFQLLVNDNSHNEILQGLVLPTSFIEIEQLNASISETAPIATSFSDDVQFSTTIFKNAPIAMVILNEKNQIIEYNQSFLDLFDTKALEHNSINDYFPEGERSKLNSTRDNQNIEIFMAHPKECILNMKILMTEDRNHKICYLTDISSEKSLEQKFNQAQKMQAVGQLAGGVAHDFNNLLTAILGHTELLLNRFNSSNAAYSDLIQIRNNANRAGNLVRQLLAFSRRQTLKPEIITLTDFLPDSSRMIERLIGERIFLKTNYAPALKPIKADITQLDQVIMNLAVNARDAMEENGGILTISTENISIEQAIAEGHGIMHGAEYVKISVSDTGHGMDEDIHAKIFEPFFTTKEQGKGTGLGLSTVYGIVKQSGGFIFADSELNKGTTFRVYFPVTHEKQEITIESTEPEKTSEAEIIVQAPHTKTVLVVEDEEAVRSFAVRAIELRGYNVLEADCGEEALELMREHHADINLIITDVMMPGLSGPEWVKKAQEIKTHFTVVFMSGYTQDHFRGDDAFNLPDLNVTFLAKPFSLKDFSKLVDERISN